MVRDSATVLRLSCFAAAIALTCCTSSFASDTAESPVDPGRSRYLRMSARASAEAGDLASAAAQLRDASRLAGDPATANRADRFARELEGGSPFADFESLIQLIQEQTAPPARWSEEDGEGGTISIFQQGVFVGVPAVMASIALMQDDSRLNEVADLAKHANRNRDIRSASTLRLISLPRLERHVAALLADGLSIPDEVRYLAGLSGIEYLFVFPESGDVVVGGPAADWSWDESGRAVSVEDGRPVVQLDDLVVLTQTFTSDGPGFFMCSIDPKQEQVHALHEFVRQHRRSLTAGNAVEFTQKVEEQLGLQNVIVDGVPADSRVAKVIVEADYRMKQIGIGEVNGARGMKSYFDLLTRSEQRGRNNMDALRWWMAVGYESIGTTDAGHAFAFTGNSVRCLSEDQILNADGTRSATGTARGANAGFADLFTRHFTELAAHDAAFADLENVFDLAMVSALLHSDGLAAEAGWQPRGFAGRGAYKPDSVDVPDELMTAAAHRVYGGRHIVVQVAGGVRGDMASVASDPERFRISGELTDSSQQASPVGHNADVWWWDAAIRQPE